MARKLIGQGLALSGGGYRASLFHLGVTRRLHELGALQPVTRVSSVSGGSILAGYLAHRMLERGGTRLAFDDWESEVSAPFRKLVRKDIRTGLLVRHLAWNWIWPAPRAAGLEKALRKRIGVVFPLPVGLPMTIYDNVALAPRLETLDGNPRDLDMDMMRDFVSDNVRARMETVEGVSSVEVWGGADRQVQIRVDPVALAERGLSVADLRTAVRERNRDITGGEIEAGKRSYLLRTIGRFESIESLHELILARRGDQVIRLGDVATVQADRNLPVRDHGVVIVTYITDRQFGEAE